MYTYSLVLINGGFAIIPLSRQLGSSAMVLAYRPFYISLYTWRAEFRDIANSGRFGFSHHIVLPESENLGGKITLAIPIHNANA
jgi:hypothetical protein